MRISFCQRIHRRFSRPHVRIIVFQENISDGASTISGTSSTSSHHHAPPPLPRPGQLPPPPPPRPPPSRGILKGRNYDKQRGGDATSSSAVNASTASQDSLDDASLLLKNTMANEAILYENMSSSKSRRRSSASSPTKKKSSSPEKRRSPEETFSPPLSPPTPVENSQADREVTYVSVPSAYRVRARGDHVSPVTPPEEKEKPPLMSPTELKALITGEGIGVSQRPLSTEVKIIVVPQSSAAADESDKDQLTRELVFERDRDSGEEVLGLEAYGLVMRRGSGGLRAGVGKARQITQEIVLVEKRSDRIGDENKLVPGDQLLEVNGVSVAGMTREEVGNVVAEQGTQGGSLVIKVILFPIIFSCLLYRMDLANDVFPNLLVFGLKKEVLNVCPSK